MSCEHVEVMVAGELGGIMQLTCCSCLHAWMIVDYPGRGGRSVVERSEPMLASLAPRRRALRLVGAERALVGAR